MRRFRLIGACVGTVVLVAGAAWAQPAEGTGSSLRGGPKIEELRDYLKSRTLEPREGVEESVGVSQLRKGIPNPVLRAAERYAEGRNRSLAGENAFDFVLQDLGSGLSESAAGSFLPSAQEAIIIPSAALRPSLFVCGTTISDPVPELWFSRLNERRAAIAETLESVCLLSYREVIGFSPRGVGTGFVVAPGIVMTNRHVAEIFSVPDGQGGWDIRAARFTGQPVEVTANFARDVCGTTPAVFQVTEILHVEPRPGADVAVLRIEDGGPPPLSLESEEPSDQLGGRAIYNPGYPFDDSRNPLWARMEVFGDVYGVKRIAPGVMQEGSGQPSGDGNVYLLHDASTLGGCSGSPIVDLESHRVVGLHFAGAFEEANFAWPIWDVLQLDGVSGHVNGD